MIADTSRRRELLEDEEADRLAQDRFAQVQLRYQAMEANLPQLTGFEDRHTRDLIKAMRYLRKARMPSLTKLLPLMLRLKGKPYTLDDYFPFEPFFRTRIARQSFLKTGRQVSKSTSLAARGIVVSNSIPFFSTLFVTPLFEMIRRFSHQYMREFIETSPVKRLFVGKRTTNQILQRSFLNGSSMYFSFAFLDAERTRGIPADENDVDEVQDISIDLLPIIHQTLSGSPWSIRRYAGTPKSLDNTANVLWEDSSQAEWVVRCHHAGCGALNIPCLTHDLLDMIGPYRRDIGPGRAGVICVECGKPLDPKHHGRWWHAYPERRWTFPGYHVPQIIMPMHYANHEKWEILVGAMNGRGNTTRTVFLNEICGEACDSGSKLVSLTDLKNAACLPWPNKAEHAVRHLKGYLRKVLAVDWGGGGGRVGTAKKDVDKRLRTSYTTLAVLGIRADGKIDCLWGHRSLRTHDYLYEAGLCVQAMVKFRCSHLVHDYNGAGAPREALIAQAGLPLRQIIATAYHPTRHDLMIFHPATDDHPRDWWSVDRSRSLFTTCEAIKYGLLRFFQFDHASADDPGLLYDFLALQEEKLDSRMSTDIFVVTRNPSMPDDFAHACNIGCCALWKMTGKWPDLAAAAKFTLTPDMLSKLQPPRVRWEDF